MKISKVIEELETIKRNAGDIEVTMRTPDPEWLDLKIIYVSCNSVVLDSEE